MHINFFEEHSKIKLKKQMSCEIAHEFWNRNLHNYYNVYIMVFLFTSFLFTGICLFPLLSLIRIWVGQRKHGTEKGTAEKSETSCQRKPRDRKEGKRKQEREADKMEMKKMNKKR